MNSIYGLYLPCADRVPAASELMRQVFCRLRQAGMMYNQILYPYADDLLLTGRIPGMLGTHALLHGVRHELICSSAGDSAVIRPLGDLFEADAFLQEGRVETPPEVMLWGSITHLATGRFSPWAIREHSRGICSFAEHLAREGKHQVLGYSGGGLLVHMTDKSAEEIGRVSRLLNTKTGYLQNVSNYSIIESQI